MSNATSERLRRALGQASLSWLLLVAAAAGLVGPGCDKTAPIATLDAPAGKVEAVEGQVTATRGAPGAKARPLATAGAVFADDTVATGPEASVSIRLLHNLALWRLDGGQSKRIDQTAAWRATKESAPQALAQPAEAVATASAGRHSEREAAASAESAVRAPHAAPSADTPAPAPAPRPTSEVAAAAAKAEPRAEQKAAKAMARPTPPSRATPRPGGSGASARRAALGGAGDDLALDLGGGESSGASGASSGEGSAKATAPKMATAGSGPATKDGAAARPSLTTVHVVGADAELHTALRRAVLRARPALQLCQLKAWSAAPSEATQLRAELSLNADGTIVEVIVTPAESPSATCARAILMSLKGLPSRPAPEKVQVMLKFAQL